MTENSPFDSGSLLQDAPGENDYTLKFSDHSCWITVDNLSVYVVRTDKGVAIEVLPRWRENDEPLGALSVDE